MKTMNAQEMAAEIARLTEQNKAMADKLAKGTVLTMKVSDKGGASLYGMGRFPVTLYAEQWTKVLDNGDNIRKFLDANKAVLSTKADKTVRDAAAATAAGTAKPQPQQQPMALNDKPKTGTTFRFGALDLGGK